jgi:tetratricopeptide (TPR) repeat protein
MRGVVHSVADTEKMYDNMMNKYHYGNLKHPDLYIDETTMRMCYTHRRWFAVLITNLIQEGKLDKALKAIEKCEEEIPAYNVPHSMDSSSLDIANGYIACGKPEKAAPILESLEKKAKEYIAWYLSLNNTYFQNGYIDCHREIYSMLSIQDVYQRLGDSDNPKHADYEKKAKKLDNDLQALYSAFVSKCDNAGIRLQ